MGQRKIDLVIVHCSATPNGKDFRASDINEWHKERPDFKPSSNGKYIGYHWVICIDGTIEMGRLESDVGAHCAGRNKDSIGVCLIGMDMFTDAQWVSLYYLLDQICTGYGLEAKQVFGHYEFDTHGKTCPNIEMEKFRDQLEIHFNQKRLEGRQNGRFTED